MADQILGQQSFALPSGTLARSSNPSSQNIKVYYKILWCDGKLGLSLARDEKHIDIAAIQQITGEGSSFGVEHARLKDRLVAINGKDTRKMGFQNTLHLLETLNKPVGLRFRRMEICEDDRNEMSDQMLWRKVRRRERQGRMKSEEETIGKDEAFNMIVSGETDIGLQLKPGPGDRIVVSRMTGKHSANVLCNAKVGDILIAVNGESVEGRDYNNITRLLKRSQKPASLRFQMGHTAKVERPTDSHSCKTESSQNNSTSKSVALLPENSYTSTSVDIALRGRPTKIVQFSKLLLEELTDAIHGLKRDSYSDEEGILHGTESDITLIHPVTSEKLCADCGRSEKSIDLKLDCDGHFYCIHCFEVFYKYPASASGSWRHGQVDVHQLNVPRNQDHQMCRINIESSSIHDERQTNHTKDEGSLPGVVEPDMSKARSTFIDDFIPLNDSDSEGSDDGKVWV